MRLVSALFPSLIVTVALFCLMQYLITSGRTGLTRPEHPGFIRLIDVTQDAEASKPAALARSAREQPASPADAPPVPPPAMTDIKPLSPSYQALVLPEQLPLDLGNGPALDLFDQGGVGQDGSDDRGSGEDPAATGTPLSPPAATANRFSEPAMPGGHGGEIIPLLRVEPVYPRKAARNGEEGWVKIEFTVTEQGSVSDPVVVDAHPRRTFDRSALSAIRQWRFKPRMVDGKPVAVRATQVIEFELAGR